VPAATLPSTPAPTSLLLTLVGLADAGVYAGGRGRFWQSSEETFLDVAARCELGRPSAVSLRVRWRADLKGTGDSARTLRWSRSQP